MSGKGSDRRARSPYCSTDEFDRRWDTIFSKSDNKCRCKNSRGACKKSKKDYSEENQ